MGHTSFEHQALHTKKYWSWRVKTMKTTILLICASMAAYTAAQGDCPTRDPCVSNGSLQAHGSANGEMVCEGHGLNREQCQAIGCCQYDDNSCYSAVGQNQCFGTNHYHFGDTHIHAYTYNTKTNQRVNQIGNQHIGKCTTCTVNIDLKNLKFTIPDVQL